MFNILIENWHFPEGSLSHGTADRHPGKRQTYREDFNM